MCLDTSGPVRVAVRNRNASLVVRTVIKEEVRLIAIHLWKGALRQFWPSRSTPEVDAIMSGGIEVLDSMLETVEVVFRWSCVGLGEFDTGKSKVRVVCHHGPDKLANATVVLNLQR